MTVGTVLVLPGGSDADRARLLALAVPTDRPWRVDVVAVGSQPAASFSARVCAAITADRPHPPLVVAAAGEGALLLPAVARAQHAAHRRVEEYLLVHPDLPAVTDAWPDAPVTIVVDDPADATATTARLRGWTVLVGSDPWQPAD